jgi:hypothetical protein
VTQALDPATTLGTIPEPLQALFDRDPLSLSRQDLNSIIEELRKQRKNFVEAESEAKTAGRRVNAKKAIAGGAKATSVSLDDLLKDI